MLCRAALARTDVSEERIAFVIRVTSIGELETTLALTSNRSTLLRNSMVVSEERIASIEDVYYNDEGNTFLRNIDSYKSHTA
jgi:hypothetical protein